MKKLRVLPLAEDEAADAALFYEERIPGLGARFLAALDVTMQRVQAGPDQSPRVGGKASPIRAATVDAFPFRVIFEEVEDAILVYAVAHMHRKPGFWKARLRQKRRR